MQIWSDWRNYCIGWTHNSFIWRYSTRALPHTHGVVCNIPYINTFVIALVIAWVIFQINFVSPLHTVADCYRQQSLISFCSFCPFFEYVTELNRFPLSGSIKRFLLCNQLRKQSSFILLIKQTEWSYMTDKIPCSSGISLLLQGIYLCYKPLFDCWNSPQVTVLRSVRNSGFRASMIRGKLRNFQILQSVSHGRTPITKRVCLSQFRPKMGLWIRSATSIRP